MNILITGASRGLGLALADESLKRGHSVIAAVRSPEHGGKLAELRERYGANVETAMFDVTDETAIARFAAGYAARGKRLEAIINNAAILTERGSSIEELDMTEVARTFDVNVLGPMRVVKHLLPLMDGTGGVIVNISSEAGSLHGAYGGDYAYGTSKTALNMFTEQLKHAVKPRGIAVYAVHPGWMKTDMGGSEAPGDPRTSASGILDLIERRTAPSRRFSFVDYSGSAMDI
ncbi:SDR family oxidoreductase [Paenibacillus thailandensis]|uniref:SDR family oxidoreductase n=1 Tax=Paenibacillus thailandensis TaxID=393250 RepID=A0ABW5R188_9BACL